ncbi:TIGR03808 family TAT-translocated repetitive protein [Ensifer soli]|uniref:TIGR03808 family TAT-translocated repetitive protein n=1 Tax=Ciceribacter sp. sgz301302 TaxID=3342379 RepID=UPI0035B7347F
MLTRRHLLALGGGLAGLATAAAARAGADHGLVPGARFDQTAALAACLERAAARGEPAVLPGGDYRISTLDLPDGTDLSGLAGRTRLVAVGDGPLLRARGAARITLAGLTLDGGGRPLDPSAAGLLDCVDVADLSLRDCRVQGSSRHGVSLDRCGGRVEACVLQSAGAAGLFALDSRGLAIAGNRVGDCGNGGILVHRSKIGPDGTLVEGNRILRIAARDGGTGENGNGINVFRAGNVIVSGNHVSDCAFSAVRVNSGSGAMIRGNQCLSSGETAIYAEFAFEGAIVSDNLVDGAANGILVVNLDVGGRLATVSGNIVRNLRLDGPYVHDGAGFGFGIAAEADTAIAGNVVENAPTYGLMLGWGPYMRAVSATGNIVRDAAVGCAVTVVEGAGSALVADNLFEACREAAIAGYRWNARTAGELIAGAPDFPHLTITGNRRS